MKKNLIIFGALFTLTLFSCIKQKDLTEDEIYTILNGIIETEGLEVDSICTKLSHIYLTEEYRQQFSMQDIQFIESQKKNFQEFHLKSDKLKKHNWRKIKTNESPYVSLDPNCKGKNYNMSFPIISLDRKKVIIEISGRWSFLSGFSEINLYIFKNNHWVRIKTFTSIQS